MGAVSTKGIMTKPILLSDRHARKTDIDGAENKATFFWGQSDCVKVTGL